MADLDRNLRLTGKRLVKQKAYWQYKMADEIVPSLIIPGPAMKVSGRPESRQEQVEIPVSAQIAERLLKMGRGSEIAVYAVLLAALKALIYHYSGSEDSIVLAPVYQPGVSPDTFNRVVVVRDRIVPDMPFKELLVNVGRTLQEAYENQDFPLADVPELKSFYLGRDKGWIISDTACVLENIHDNAALAGLSAQAVFVFCLAGSHMQGKIVFDAALYERFYIERLAGHFVILLDQALADVQVPVCGLPVLSGLERAEMLESFCTGEKEAVPGATIVDLFLDQVDRTTDRIALSGETVGANGHSPLHCSVSYKELDRRATDVAGELRAQGIGQGSVVALLTGRTVEMIVGLLGILKAGAAYLPIDPSYPQERIDYMLADSGAEIVIGSQAVGANCCSPIQDIGAECKGERQFAPTDLAYVIYTSGSTGRPKGVLTTHRNVIRVVKNTNYIDISEHDRLLQLSNYAFDGSVFDIYGALLNGAALVMVDRQQLLSVDRLQALIKREQVTVFFVTTALFNTLVDIALQGLSQVHRVLFGGERVSVEHVKKALDVLGKDRVTHVYGPTETTVYACFYPVNKVAATAYTVPIGRPLTDTTVYILDKYLHLVPIGVAGELYIGGAGLARGYLNNPELTAERFVTLNLTPGPSPSVERGDWWSGGPRPNQPVPERSRGAGTRLYKTGDLGRWLEGGDIEFLGRVDAQVKIRGFRIEPGEIEACLIQHPAVSEAVVTVIEERGDRALCAYLVTKKPDANTGPLDAQLREFLARHLPDYMVPAYFVLLNAFPLNPSGKIDRKKLPGPQIDTGPTFVPPGDELEEALAQIWAGILLIDQDKISIDADFFRLGGHSLKAATLVSRIRVQFNIEISLIEVFKNPTIRGLATLIRAIQWVSHAGAAPAEEEEELTL